MPMFNPDKPQLSTIAAKLQDLREEMSVIRADAEAQGRDLTEMEQHDLKRLAAKWDSLHAQVRPAEIEDTMNRPQPRPVIDFAPRRGSGTSGFNSFGGYLSAVKAASSGAVDPRLVRAAVSTYGNEAFGADGGFAVPPDFRAAIWEIVAGRETVLGQFRQFPTPSSMLTLPVDDSASWSSTGVTAEWTGEGATITASKPALAQRNVTLHKVAALTHLSDELLADSPAMGTYIAQILAKKIRAVVEDAIVAGNGNGKPTGLTAAPGLVTQAKSATTLQVVDLASMASRHLDFANAFWIVHSSALPVLWTLTIGQMPAMQQDFTRAPGGVLLGRPVFVSESCGTYNSGTDILLAAPDSLLVAVKSSGLQLDSTIGLAFDQGLQSFRATMRIGSTPSLAAAVARRNGSATLSNVVTMGVRS